MSDKQELTHTLGDELTLTRPNELLSSGQQEVGPVGADEPVVRQTVMKIGLNGEWYWDAHTPEELAQRAEWKATEDAERVKLVEAHDAIARLAEVRDRWADASQEEKNVAMFDAIKMLTRKIPGKGA